MPDYPNLRGNFQHIVRTASVRDLQTMVSVLADELLTFSPAAAGHLALASDCLDDRRRQFAARKSLPSCAGGVVGCERVGCTVLWHRENHARPA